ncbi:MAG TPA: glycosyltransferase family 4 protein [Allocoleopsis sp.]
MKVAYVTEYDAGDISKWSGTGYYITKSLKNQGLSLDYLGPLVEKYSLLFKGKQGFYRYLMRKRYWRDREPLILRHYAQQVARKLSTLKPDLVLSPGTVPIAHLESDRPVVFWTDATFAGLIDFYAKYSNLCQETIENGHKMEQLALDKCQLAIYSSDWAAKTAIENYQVDPSKVKVVPFGANIECDRVFDDIKTIVDSRPSNQCNLLFLGVEWSRKGGNIAINVAEELNKQGLPTKLTIVGCNPIAELPLPDFVTTLGFVSKTTEGGLRTIQKLLTEAHFLILPSKAECYGIVFCEANSFGVPCLTTNVGGIPTIIQDDLNGKTFDKEAKVKDYCAYIFNLFSDYSQYKELALSSFKEYQCRLNWSVAGKTVKKLLKELVI